MSLIHQWVERLGASGWTARRWAWLRVALGGYFAVHFGALVPWAVELFSSEGLLPEAAASPLMPAFPNLLAVFDGPLAVTLFVAAGAALGLAMAAGYRDRLAALGIWYVLSALTVRNPLILNPALPFLGWALLAHAAVGPAPFAGGRARVGWRLPAPVFAAAWAVMGAAYTYSAVTKLGSASWVDGQALMFVLENPLARPTPLREALLALPAGWLKVATWGGLGLELLALPMALSRRLRPWLWAGLLVMHLGLIALVDFADLTVGVLLFHALITDLTWPSRVTLWRSRMRSHLGEHHGPCHRATVHVRRLFRQGRRADR